MPDTKEVIRVQVVKGRVRWGARLCSEPEQWFIGRSCAEALGRLCVAHKGLLGLLLAGFTEGGKRHVPTAEPAQHGQRSAYLAEIVEVESLPPMWTIGLRGRDKYYAVPHPRHQRGTGAA